MHMHTSTLSKNVCVHLYNKLIFNKVYYSLIYQEFIKVLQSARVGVAGHSIPVHIYLKIIGC